jgi:EAL domain-containing protein (putative c-di-GMP-specific phosphodiesterase class I)
VLLLKIGLFSKRLLLLKRKLLRGDWKILEFGITESVAMSDFNLIEKRLKELKSLGVTIAMDDFVTVYSSLNYLKKLPIDTLKIDQSFIKDIHDDQHDQTLIKTIISMVP